MNVMHHKHMHIGTVYYLRLLTAFTAISSK